MSCHAGGHTRKPEICNVKSQGRQTHPVPRFHTYGAPSSARESPQYYAAAAKRTKTMFFLFASLNSLSSRYGWSLGKLRCGRARAEAKACSTCLVEGRGIIGSVLYLKLLKILEPHLHSIGRSRIWSLT